MASETRKRVFKEVRPLLSIDRCDAKRRVINLYKIWFRQIPYILKQHDVEFSERRCKEKLRQEFTKHRTISDIRVIDMLVFRGHMDLKEAVEMWVSKRGIAKYFSDHLERKPDCFLDKFLDGRD